MIFQPVVCGFQSINMKRFSASEGDNKVGSQDRLGYAFCLINNFGSSDKAVREVSTHLTDEPKYSFNHKQTPQKHKHATIRLPTCCKAAKLSVLNCVPTNAL